MKYLVAFLLVTVMITLGYLYRSQPSSGLVWDRTTQSFDLAAGATSHRAEFKFENRSNKSIAIDSIKPDCNCLVPSLAEKTIPPHGHGILEVDFNPGDRAGELDRKIEVKTKEFPDHPSVLKIHYHIPELVKVCHRLLFWKVGDVPSAQDIDLTMPSEPIRVLGIRSSSQNFHCEVSPTSDGRGYQIRVLPLSLEKPRQSVLLIDTDYPHAPWNRIVANVKIQ